MLVGRLTELRAQGGDGVVVVIQALGLLSACTARLSEGSGRQTSCQRLFFVCLLLVGWLAATARAAMGISKAPGTQRVRISSALAP